MYIEIINAEHQRVKSEFLWPDGCDPDSRSNPNCLDDLTEDKLKRLLDSMHNDNFVYRTGDPTHDRDAINRVAVRMLGPEYTDMQLSNLFDKTCVAGSTEWLIRAYQVYDILPPESRNINLPEIMELALDKGHDLFGLDHAKHIELLYDVLIRIGVDPRLYRPVTLYGASLEGVVINSNTSVYTDEVPDVMKRLKNELSKGSLMFVDKLIDARTIHVLAIIHVNNDGTITAYDQETGTLVEMDRFTTIYGLSKLPDQSKVDAIRQFAVDTKILEALQFQR